jgi:hypothetical protein
MMDMIVWSTTIGMLTTSRVSQTVLADGDPSSANASKV